MARRELTARDRRVEPQVAIRLSQKKTVLGRLARYSAMEVVHEPERSRFAVHLAPGAYAFLKYEIRGKTVYIKTVYTPPEFRGRGVATRLMETALKWVEENGYKVVPVCSFAASFFEKHPEWRRLLDESALAEA